MRRAVISIHAPEPKRVGPLRGIVVIDASTTIAGPSVAGFLADYGATVIKVEHPDGDPGRLIGENKGDWWNWLSREKYLTSCNLSSADGAALFRKLATRADVVIENFRPGRMESWGLGYEVLSRDNPHLVMLRITGFGQDGPYSSRRAYGALAEAMSGAAHMTGVADGPPTLSDLALGDSSAGLMGAAACLIALLARERDPDRRGDCIDLPLYSPLLWMLGKSVIEYQRTAVSPSRSGGHMGRSARNVRRCRDGHWVAYSIFAALGSGTSLVRMLGLQHDPRFSTPEVILTHGPDLDVAIGDWISEHDREDVLARCIAADVPIIAVNDFEDIMNDPHIRARGDLLDAVRDGVDIKVPGPPVRFRNRPASAGPVPLPNGAPGGDNEEIFSRFLGLTTDELRELRLSGAI